MKRHTQVDLRAWGPFPGRAMNRQPLAVVFREPAIKAARAPHPTYESSDTICCALLNKPQPLFSTRLQVSLPCLVIRVRFVRRPARRQRQPFRLVLHGLRSDPQPPIHVLYTETRIGPPFAQFDLPQTPSGRKPISPESVSSTTSMSPPPSVHSTAEP